MASSDIGLQWQEIQQKNNEETAGICGNYDHQKQ